ncbi:hypothetical protein Poli38472_000715 [Pythium oligandrum]|uniref:Exportin-1/Importin-beta-like domain-containing protein n=1 Tax=Pythium oligandrum TaxID=41045 RepID=A0A8K1FJE7_PYTOL|nr:hypothetical protein Poli38472_000715 [Pythium oligandrum]|eukprot:TMW60673.1 hypothetical protein Poli38472_000715 [Pythium oligandrum]
MEVSVVAEAINQLYNPLSSPKIRRRADSLLQRFQRSPEAAQTALRVLQAPIPAETNPTITAQLKAERAFAASTLYFTVATYVRKYKLEDVANWTPEERLQHEMLTQEFVVLCQQVWDILTGPSAAAEEFNVQTHLALTVAVILLRFHEQHNESSVVAAVEWLVSNQQRPMTDDLACNVTNFAILLTLKVIPEEVDNKRVKFFKIRRAACEMMVQQAAANVVQNVLPSIASAIDANEDQSRLRGLLLQCFSSWIEYGSITPALLLESGLLNRAFGETLHRPFSNEAFSVIREAVRACKNDSHLPMMVFVMKEFVNLGKHIREQLASPTPERVAFCLKNCATAISECGQAFIKYFVDYDRDGTTGPLVFEFLETILAFTALNHLEISNETMEFWIDFRVYISGKHEERMYEFEIFISRLLNILVERTQYPRDYKSFSAVAKEQFGVYRNDVRCVFRALATASAASEDRFIVDAIYAIFHQYELADAGQVDDTWWRKTEVYVHALSALSKSIRQEDTSLVPRLFEYLSRDQPNHFALSRTASILLGVASHWFARNPSYIDLYALKILSRSFGVVDGPQSIPYRGRSEEDHVGAVALRKLTSLCGTHMFTPMWLEALVQLYRVSLSAPRKKAGLVDSSVALIVESVANIVANVPYKDAFPVIDQLCSIMFEDFVSRYGTLNPDDDDSIEFLSVILDHLHVLVTRIPPQINQEVPHPMLQVLQKQWGLLEGILRAYGANEDVMEKFCGMLVGLLETIRFEALDLASAIMSNLLEQFARTYDGNFLRVIKGVIMCAGDDEETMASLTRVFVIVVETSLSKIAAAGSVDECPVLIMALFDLVAACGEFRPMILVQSHQFESLLALILHALKAQSPDVGSATLSLLKEIGSWYGEVQRTPHHLLQSGELEGKVRLHQLIQTLFFERDVQYHLLVALFHAAGGAMPQTLLETIAEVIRSCWTYFGRRRSEELIMRMLSDDGFMQVPQRTRGEFVSTISKQDCIDNSRKFRRVLSTFCDHFKKCTSGTPSVMS